MPFGLVVIRSFTEVENTPQGQTRGGGLLGCRQLEHQSPVRLLVDADDPDTGQPEKLRYLLGYL